MTGQSLLQCSAGGRAVAVVTAYLLLCRGGAALAQTPPKAPPKKPTPWLEMDYGPVLAASIESPLPVRNMTPKGLAIRVNPGRSPAAYVLFDIDLLRYSAGWSGGLIDWKNVLFDGSHRTWASIGGEGVFGNGLVPGWGDGSGKFEDPRVRYKATEYKPLPPSWRERGFGPLPEEWGRYRGMYVNGDRVVLSYMIGKTRILDSPGMEELSELGVFTRTLEVGESDRDLVLQVLEGAVRPEGGVVTASTGGKIAVASAIASATKPSTQSSTQPAGSDHRVLVAISTRAQNVSWNVNGGAVRLRVAASSTPTKLKLLLARIEMGKVEEFAAAVRMSREPLDLAAFTHGGPRRYAQELTTAGKRGSDDKPYTVDTLAAPTNNPWKARLRFSGLDFFRDGKRAAVCTWDGDVWLLSNIDDSLGSLTWRRIATGLHQPLGLKIVSSGIFVCCRDQIVRLHDLNGDEEIDFYECFNTDHQVTEHFHEFAMGLQTDAQGNFYYAKSARHALDAVVPQHGTVMKVSADGSKSEIIASGFRAANGIGVGPNGEIAASDQEGFWTPANRINLISRPGGFYGNMWSYQATPRRVEQGYDPPLCFIPQAVDRSPAEELWVTSQKWGPLKGSMLHMSYGAGKLFLVPYEIVGGVAQGGVVPFDLSFTTGIMRGRFNPADGQLYVCGLFGWSSNTSDPGGLYRVRYTGRPVHLPVGVNVMRTGVALTFTNPLDKAAAEDVGSYGVQRWNYRWSEKYGSPHLSFEKPEKTGEDDVEVTSATLSSNGKTVLLQIPDHKPVMQMKIEANVKAADGTPIKLTLHHTINVVPKE